METGTTKKSIETLVQSWKNERTLREKDWQDIADYIAPNTIELLTDKTNNAQRQDYKIYNNTPSDAHDIAVSGLLTNICDPTERWPAVVAQDAKKNKMHRVRKYCEEISEVLYHEFARSNFYQVAEEDFRSMAGFGTCASAQHERYDDHGSIFHFSSMPLGTFYCRNNAERIVDQTAYEFTYTAAQMWETFARRGGKLSLECSCAIKDPRKHGEEFKVMAVVMPNRNYRAGLAPQEYKRYLVYYYHVGQQSVGGDFIMIEGFDELPIQVARWRTVGSQSWGFGMGHRAIGDSMGLQSYEFDIALATELSLKPPMMAPPGFDAQDVQMLPAGITFLTDMAAAEGLRPLYQVNFDVQKARVNSDKHEERIRRAFWNHIFQAIAVQDGQMTAREIIERARERRTALTPILRITNEYLTPRIAFSLSVLARRGKLPPIPPEMEGEPLKIEYRNGLIRAAEIESAQATMQAVGAAAQLVQIKPDVLDNIDTDEALHEYVRKIGAPATILLDPDKRDDYRAQKARQEAAAQQAAMAMQQAETAKTLSQADTSKQSALTELLNAVK